VQINTIQQRPGNPGIVAVDLGGAAPMQAGITDELYWNLRTARAVVAPIIRDKVIREETYAKSAVIIDTVDNGPQVAYINLPSFYANFNDAAGRKSSTDLKKEVEKIKREGLNDIILDMRNNGGGSLMDAVDIAGLFIKNGNL